MDLLNEENPTVIINNVNFGKNVKGYHFINLYGCSIGDESKIDSFVEIQKI